MRNKRKRLYGHKLGKCDTALGTNTPVDDFVAGIAQHYKMIDERKWVWHYVVDDLSDRVNVHTHGLAEHFGHVDLQITLPLSMSRVQGIFNSAMAEIREGRRFVDGEIADRILCEPYKVKFVRAEENDREVLRIIIPDAEGNLDPETMDRIYARQYDDLSTNQP